MEFGLEHAKQIQRINENQNALILHENNWNEFKNIQLSFFKASVIDIELITDQAILAVTYKIARYS